MRGAREEQKRLTRNRILDAAVTVFREKSFVDATMDDIAHTSGVSRVTIYAHFSGKTEIIRALSGRVYEVSTAIYADLAAREVWTTAAIREWLDVAEAHWQRLAPMILVLSAAADVVVDGGTRDRYVAAREHYVALLTEDRGRWRDTPRAEARQRALMAVLQLDSFLGVYLAVGWKFETADPLDLLADTLCHILGPALTR
ncbi:TetR/AcrR family transcriptional regulator [Amycolatopsis sp. GM8]|uniref:TetR/AcrR family transcriptional regulator n=1 Tax=Amycolatopsis sp. GM8 TaxID=2896530 RepID=UPI001F35071F|nr:TetR/AcrR family transcriptional regulator [Amycolatopsis sp. GM8]